MKGQTAKDINVIAKLKDENNEILKNKKIQFTINEKTYIKTTDDGGIAKVIFKGSSGNYAMNAKYMGDNLFSSSSKDAKLIISNTAPNLKVSSIVGDKNKKIQLKATLIGANNKKLANKNIKFYVNNIAVGSSKTNKNGLAILNYKAILNSGKYTVSAIYDSDLSNSATLKIKKAGLYIQITSSKAKPKIGNTVTIYYRIKNDGPDPATNTKLTYKIPSNLNYVKAVATGTKKYNPKTKTFVWFIKKAKVGTSLLKITFKTKKSGRVLLTPKITTDTYNSYPKGKNLYLSIL
jgi:uncharacterized repeat protein (TIGR01451 family)